MPTDNSINRTVNLLEYWGSKTFNFSKDVVPLIRGARRDLLKSKKKLTMGEGEGGIGEGVINTHTNICTRKTWVSYYKNVQNQNCGFMQFIIFTYLFMVLCLHLIYSPFQHVTNHAFLTWMFLRHYGGQLKTERVFIWHCLLIFFPSK